MSLTPEQQSFFSNPFSDFWPFIEQHDFPREELFLDLEEQYDREGIYSIGPWFGRFLDFLVRFGQAKNVLEFGTASGYSGIWLARGLPTDGKLVTIERDPHCIKLARENFERAEVSGRVDLMEGDAEVVTRGLSQLFDLVFVDCAHEVALENAEKLLRKGGLFVCDNIAFTNKQDFNTLLTRSAYLETLFLQCYLKKRVPENTAFSISIKT